MRNVPIKNQLLTILLIAGVSYFLFTLFPTIFSHPEDLSPYAYVVAMLAGIEVFIFLKEGKRRWFVIPILIVCLLALLDESGYGSEVMNIKPFYSQTLHAEIRDLHNLIGIVVELGVKALNESHWQANVFIQFLAIDGIILVAGLLFGWLLRIRTPKSKAEIGQRILWITSWFWFVAGLVTIAYLLSLPQDPKNVFLLRFSLTRLASIMGILLISIMPMVFQGLKGRTNKKGRKPETAWPGLQVRIARVVFAVLASACLIYQLYAPFVFLPDQQVLLERISPLVLWLFSLSWFSLLSIKAWRGGLRKPLTELFVRFANFLRREPAYFYAINSVFVILIAQLIDRNLIPLNTVIQTPNFHVKLWGLWTEETLEMIGAFLFLFAVSYFPAPNTDSRNRQKDQG